VSATRPITPADWVRMKANLSGLFGSEDLLCDGYKLTISRQQSKNRLHLVIFINGEWKGSWITTDCEERRRFFCPSTKRLYSQKKIDEILKGLGQRQKKKFIAEHKMDRAYTSYSPYWNSFDSLRRHLVKNNKEIMVQLPEQWVVVTYPGGVVFEAGSFFEAKAHSVGVYGIRGDVMKRLPDGTLTTEF
jgi:hypothetical protein